MSPAPIFILHEACFSDSQWPADFATVLVVEDDAHARDGLVVLLEFETSQGVLTATTAAEAIEVLVSTRPDLLILDIGLPDMSGTWVFERARQLWPGLPAIAMSGHADPSIFASHHGVDFLPKPFAFEALVESARLLIRHPSMS